jgi:hypothetical protein
MVIKEKHMRISRKKIIIRFVMIGLLIPVALTLVIQTKNFLHKSIAQSFKIEHITFHVEHIYSSQLAQEITSFISTKTTQESLLSFDQQAFRKGLKKKFSIIKAIEWEYRMPHTLHLKIVGTQPVCKINNTYILGNKTTLFNQEFFKDSDLGKLENISVNPKLLKKNKIAKGLRAFIEKIPAEHWQKFSISYHKPTYIELHPKQSFCKFFIITDQTSFFDTKKLASINPIFTDMYKKHLLTQKMLQAQKPLIAFDTRFAQRIVVKFFDNLRRGIGK